MPNPDSNPFPALSHPSETSYRDQAGSQGHTHDADGKLQALERTFLAAAVETTDDAVIGMTLDAKRVTYWNRGAERLYGWSASEIVGQPFSRLVPDDKRAEFEISRASLATHTAPSVILDTVRLHKSGARVEVSGRVGFVRDPDTGEALGLCAIARDITVRRAVEVGLFHAQAQDRKISLALQRPMLFQPNEDAFSGLAVQTAYVMASEEALVGGDYWDTFALDSERIALVLGDVMGHGLTSAIFTTELKYIMRAYLREHVQPALVLSHMNTYLCQSNRLFREGINSEGSDAPVCLSLAIIVRETGTGTLAMAGMEPPLLLRANQQAEPVSMTAGGVPLGIWENEVYQQVDFQLESGDTLLLTTDGITEARQGRVFLDTEGLVRLAVAGGGGTLKAMADTILNGALDFAGGKLKDDASLVLVRRTTTFVPQKAPPPPP